MLVFVFGSNARGNHVAGAAKLAQREYGAVNGIGHGMSGSSYAIDTMSGWDALKYNVSNFIRFAQNNPDKCFYVTPIGCGIAGYKTEDIVALFKNAPFNVALCMDLVKALSIREHLEKDHGNQRV